MNKHEVVKDFQHEGRRCVVILIDRVGSNPAREFLERPLFVSLKPYCCGYVELKEDEVLKDYDDYLINSDELTYQGDLKFKNLDASDGKIYIGFDSAHAWNDVAPESKTPEYVAETCKKIVEELNKEKGKLIKLGKGVTKMENKDWDKINEEKRLSILKGQTMNQAFEVVKEDLIKCKRMNLEDFKNYREKIETNENEILNDYRRIYHKLLKANKELLDSDENKS